MSNKLVWITCHCWPVTALHYLQASLCTRMKKETSEIGDRESSWKRKRRFPTYLEVNIFGFYSNFEFCILIVAKSSTSVPYRATVFPRCRLNKEAKVSRIFCTWSPTSLCTSIFARLISFSYFSLPWKKKLIENCQEIRSPCWKNQHLFTNALNWAKRLIFNSFPRVGGKCGTLP